MKTIRYFVLFGYFHFLYLPPSNFLVYHGAKYRHADTNFCNTTAYIYPQEKSLLLFVLGVRVFCRSVTDRHSR